MLAADAIVRAVGSSNAAKYWPLVISALRTEGIDSDAVRTAAAATIATEVPNFAPIREYASGAAYEPPSALAARLGNTQPGDGPRYKGRGFIQLTGRANYAYYGRRLGVDLINNPDLALDPVIASRILAAYFKERGVAAAANRGDWREVRRLVNGGYNGWDRFIGVVNTIGGMFRAAAGAAASAAASAATSVAKPVIAAVQAPALTPKVLGALAGLLMALVLSASRVMRGR